VLPKVVLFQRKRLPNDRVDVYRSFFPDTVPEYRANAFNHFVRAMAIGGMSR
jgi:hypothetical protein